MLSKRVIPCLDVRNGRLTKGVKFAGNEDIGDPVASISRPVRELKNFRRITLKPGETQGVTFRITTADLKFYNSELEHVWEPGEFNVCIGPNSRDVKTAKINWTK